MSSQQSKTPMIQRAFFGLLTGAFMFGAYFFMDMGAYTLYGEDNFLVSNRMFFIMFSFFIGAVLAQFYIWFYKRGQRVKVK